jgi:hypothetical protein
MIGSTVPPRLESVVVELEQDAKSPKVRKTPMTAKVFLIIQLRRGCNGAAPQLCLIALLRRCLPIIVFIPLNK